MTIAPSGSGPLAGRVALVTGVSRRIGIAATVAQRLIADGATVYVTGWPPHDAEMPWGLDDDGPTIDRRNLEQPDEPAALVDAVIARHGALDIVVAVHARSSHNGLFDVTADELDRCWAANVRSIVLLAKRFAETRDEARPGGRFVWFTSGQHIESMHAEIAYAVTKGALHQLTASLAHPLADRGIVANCINPGPTDTGWADPTAHDAIATMFPSGRWGTPIDVANLVSFLVSDQGEWIVGQVLNSEGGFRRSASPPIDRTPRV
jgi:3-oxoacyl-[acyl-carrier protein] reductase